MKIEYEIKGVTLDVSDLCEISKYFEAACTAEYLLDAFDQIKNEKQAMEIGYEVRRLMDKYGYDEEEAIEVALNGG